MFIGIFLTFVPAKHWVTYSSTLGAAMRSGSEPPISLGQTMHKQRLFEIQESPTPANNSSLLDDESLLQHRVSSSPAKELKFACSWGLMTISGLILSLSTCSLLLGSLPHLNGGVEGIKTAKQCGKLRLFSRLAWQQSRHHDKRPLRKKNQMNSEETTRVGNYIENSCNNDDTNLAASCHSSLNASLTSITKSPGKDSILKQIKPNYHL